MFWIIVEKVGILGGLISLILLFKQYLWPYLLRLWYYPKIDEFLEIFFNPSTTKVGERISPCIAFPKPKGKVNDDRFLQLKGKYKLILKKISFHFPIGEVFINPVGKGWSYPDVRKKGYLTFDYFPIDPLLKQPELLQPGDALELGNVQLQKAKKAGEYKILTCAELLLETRIGYVKLLIQKEPVIKIITI